MTAPPGPPGPTDAELVARVLAADREAFATVYDRYGDRLYDFAHAMLRHREDAADAVADSFVLFAERLPQLRDPDRLRPWLYAIVRTECLRRLKARKRIAYGDEEQLVAMPDDAITPEQSAERAALQQLVWDASAGLADRDRAVLDLHLRQGLEGAELGEAIGVSANNAYVMLSRLRDQVDRSLGALLIARLGRDDCDDLDGILADWDGGFSPLIRKRVARHVDRCEVCSERRRKMLSPWVLLAGVPLLAAPLGLRDRVLGDTQLVAHHVAGDGAYEWLDGAQPAATGGHRWGGPRTTLAAAALLAVALVATVLLWPDTREVDDAVSPAQVGPTPTSTVLPSTSAPTSADPGTSASAEPTPGPTATTPSVAPSLLPGALTASTRSIALGRTATRGTFQLSNTGEQPVIYTVSSRARWLGVAPIGGELAGGDDRQVGLLADRSAVPEGRVTGRVVVGWDGGSLTIRVSLDEERAPVVGTPTTPSAPSCDVPVTVRVTDESRISAVQLSWSGPGGSGTVPMAQTGADWSATLRIALGGTYSLVATATDARGNSASGPTAHVDLNPCPQ